jgi:hypothetical protein
MKVAEILKNIEENGGFDNFNKWNKKQIAEWVKANFNCSDYISKKVAESI